MAEFFLNADQPGEIYASTNLSPYEFQTSRNLRLCGLPVGIPDARRAGRPRVCELRGSNHALENIQGAVGLGRRECTDRRRKPRAMVSDRKDPDAHRHNFDGAV